MLLKHKTPYLFFRYIAFVITIIFVFNHTLAQDSDQLEENFENAENAEEKRLKWGTEEFKLELIKEMSSANIALFIDEHLKKINEPSRIYYKFIKESTREDNFKGNVVLNYCGLNNNHLSYIAEQPSSLKLNLYVPGSNLKIVSDDILLEDQPDYIFLLAWHLSEPIIKKWRKRGLKSKFIVPLPNLQIYE